MLEWAITGTRPEYELDQIIEDGIVGVITAVIAGDGAKAVKKVGQILGNQGHASTGKESGKQKAASTREAGTMEDSLVSDAMADQMLRERTTVSFLTRKGGLKLTKGMSQEQKRAAVRQAVNQIIGKKKENTLPKGTASDSIEIESDSFTIGVGVGAKAKNYDVMDLESGEIYHFVEGSKIQDVKVFAGKGTKVQLRIAGKYTALYGGIKENWQHVKGFGMLETPDGDRKVEVHWMQCQDIGKFDFFIKRWLD